jgi:hypothetical protein
VAATGPPANRLVKETTMRRTLTSAALLLALATAGCGQGSEPQVATLHSGPPRAGASATATGQDSELKFSQCMRAQGLAWFPDPGADGGLKVHVPEGTDQSTVDTAEKACQAYDPAATRQGQISAGDLDKVRANSRCIREHGFPKWPDPDANGTTEVNNQALGADPDDPALQKAMQDCAKYLPPRNRPGKS